MTAQKIIKLREIEDMINFQKKDLRLIDDEFLKSNNKNYLHRSKLILTDTLSNIYKWTKKNNKYAC